MLKKLRVIISLLFFVTITFYFVDFAGLLPNGFHVLAHLQFIPALLGHSLFILLFLIILTLLFGRIYCSSICPMGVYQDIAAWTSKHVAPKRKKYAYSKSKTWLRWGIVAVIVLCMLLGLPVALALADPYSAFGRMAVHIFKPVYLAGNNLLETIFTRFDNYTFYKVDIVVLSISSFVIALLTFVIIDFLAWRNGRTYCNTVCPVGTILGAVSRYSFFKIRLNKEKCNHCGLCAMNCKASCIDSKEGTVDHSRCVTCFNCLNSCNKDALTYSRKKKKLVVTNDEKVNESKREFIITGIATAISVPSLLAQGKNNLLSGGKVYTRQTPITPPGSKSAERFMAHCSSCHLCITKCPSNVLKPAFLEYGLGGMMQPMMYFQKGYCNYNCTVCADVCPNRAILPLTVDEKHRTQVGYAVFNEDICVVHTNGTSCGACAEHCPTQAVSMQPYKNGLTIPVVNTDICVGCGGCEFICPVRPHTAIYVEGNKIHKEAIVSHDENDSEIIIDDFGF